VQHTDSLGTDLQWTDVVAQEWEQSNALVHIVGAIPKSHISHGASCAMPRHVISRTQHSLTSLSNLFIFPHCVDCDASAESKVIVPSNEERSIKDIEKEMTLGHFIATLDTPLISFMNDPSGRARSTA
jgi:hypothetical protein